MKKLKFEFKKLIEFHMEKSSKVNIGTGKSAFDKKPLGERFGNKNVYFDSVFYFNIR